MPTWWQSLRIHSQLTSSTRSVSSWNSKSLGWAVSVLSFLACLVHSQASPCCTWSSWPVFLMRLISSTSMPSLPGTSTLYSFSSATLLWSFTWQCLSSIREPLTRRFSTLIMKEALIVRSTLRRSRSLWFSSSLWSVCIFCPTSQSRFTTKTQLISRAELPIRCAFSTESPTSPSFSHSSISNLRLKRDLMMKS